MATGAVSIQGLRELQIDLRRMSKELGGEFRAELRAAAEPVKKTGQELALGKIRNMPRSPHWAGMRIGISGATIVYMVPAARSRGRPRGGRPNLANLLMDRAMEPALEQHQDEVVVGVERMVDRLASANGF